MSDWEVVLAAALKILFILVVVIGAFAPALVWAERRQSAMIQDRVGPHRADIPVGTWLPGLVDFANLLRGPLRVGSSLSLAAGIVVLLVAVVGMLGGRNLLLVGDVDEHVHERIVEQGYDVQRVATGSLVAAENLDAFDVVYATSEREAVDIHTRFLDAGQVTHVALVEPDPATEARIAELEGLLGGQADPDSAAGYQEELQDLHEWKEARAVSTLASAPAILGLSMPMLVGAGLLLLLFAGALSLGYKVHSGFVASGGKIRLLGLLHPAADAVKMMWKEDFVPPNADKVLHALAPIITVIPAIVSFAVIPFADALWLDQWDQVFNPQMALSDDPGPVVPMQVASLNIGVLFIFAVAGTGIIGAAIGGYASDNKYSLMGGLRAASQMVSYEVALGLTVVPCFMFYGTLRLEEMALWQHMHGWWGIFIPPLTLAAILYFTCAVAETKRVPFDAPEGESELVGGYLTEYSGMKFGMFFTGEFVEVVALSALAAIFFFGGWDVPFLMRDGFDLPGTWEIPIPLTEWMLADRVYVTHWIVLAIQVVVFLFKITVLVWFQLMIRWTLPRFRYDQIMALCWKGILPLALLNILITGIVVLLWG